MLNWFCRILGKNLVAKRDETPTPSSYVRFKGTRQEVTGHISKATTVRIDSEMNDGVNGTAYHF